MCLVDTIQGIVLRSACQADLADIAALHAAVFGPGRFARTAYRIREGTAHVSPYCGVAHKNEKLVAAVCFTPITIGGRRGALLLGPLAVAPSHANIGLGRGLVGNGLTAARNDGRELVVLVGDLDYYARMGFQRIAAGIIQMSGPVDPMRLLAHELNPDALAQFSGLIAADPTQTNPAGAGGDDDGTRSA